ncbi:MAG TPA: condensation domain-containing protein, partial [Thermoanaerobaculia bacterium]
MQTAIMQGFRLSPQQRHLWPLLQGSSVFSAQCVLSLVGPLDAAELRRAFDRVVARHEALRTCFRRRRGEKLPLQIVAEAGNVAWRESDLTAEDPAEWSAACTRAAADERSEAFDLEAGPLLRLLLLRGAAERHALVVTLPALAADPATLRNLLREAVDLYARRPPAILDDEVVQYLQFSEWQQEMLESEEADVAARDDWRQKCAALPPFPALPGERPAGDPEGFASARLRLPVEPELATALESASAACGVSIEVFLLAAWTLTLACLTGEPGVTVRAAVDGRPFEDLQGAFGLLGKTLPLQTQVEDSFRFEELAQRVGRSLEEACGRQESFDSEAVNGAGERLDADAVDFEMRQGPADLDGGGVAFSLLEEHVCWERFKLKLLALHRQDALALEVWYDESRLGAAEAGRVAAALRALLAAASAEPKARVGDLDLLGEAERSALLVGFNATRQPFPAAARGWHELFEAQAESTPESPALACEGERLTYRELNARANRLARRLRELGVGPEARVALWAERSLELVVGLLAVLKSGGA